MVVHFLGTSSLELWVVGKAKTQLLNLVQDPGAQSGSGGTHVPLMAMWPIFGDLT